MCMSILQIQMLLSWFQPTYQFGDESFDGLTSMVELPSPSYKSTLLLFSFYYELHCLLKTPLVFSIHTKWGSASFICNAVVFYKGFIIEIIDLIWGYFSNCVSIIAVPISSSTIFNTCICSFTCTLLPHIQAVCFIKSCSN